MMQPSTKEVSMNKTLIYLLDPLCGWCYGALPTLFALNNVADINVELIPTGLFSGAGARPMNHEFATYAWGNDQRIAHLTGQSFTEHYREQVLNDHQQRFDSGPATLALTAVSLTEPARELETLKAIQQARFIDGLDITKFQTLVAILTSMKLNSAAAMLESADDTLRLATQTRTQHGRAFMQDFGAHGVPTYIASVGAKRWLLNSSDVYSNPNALISQLGTI
jgi:putative protein-disulfide isomerase